jgi:hypothetical protein
MIAAKAGVNFKHEGWAHLPHLEHATIFSDFPVILFEFSSPRQKSQNRTAFLFLVLFCKITSSFETDDELLLLLLAFEGLSSDRGDVMESLALVLLVEGG